MTPVKPGRSTWAISASISRTCVRIRHLQKQSAAQYPRCWSRLVLQHGAEGTAADLQEYRIVFRVGQEHDSEVQCPALGPRPQGVVDPDPSTVGAADRLVSRPEAGMAVEREQHPGHRQVAG